MVIETDQPGDTKMATDLDQVCRAFDAEPETGIPVGEILTIPGGRMIYLGARKCDVQLWYPERGATGGLTKTGNGEWKTHKAAQDMSDAQIARWNEIKGQE
jgi:hypothetical protein